jgi:hypothetical protein
MSHADEMLDLLRFTDPTPKNTYKHSKRASEQLAKNKNSKRTSAKSEPDSAHRGVKRRIKSNAVV